MTWNALSLKVKCSVSDSFLERSAPTVNAVQRIGPILGTESHYHSLGLEARFLLPNQKIGSISIQYSVINSTADRSDSVRFSRALFTLHRIDFRTGTKMDPV